MGQRAYPPSRRLPETGDQALSSAGIPADRNSTERQGYQISGLFRTLYFLPVGLFPVIVALVFGLIFDGDNGLVNVMLTPLFGIPTVPWLTDEFWAKIVVVPLVLRRWTGYLTIFFLAGLKATLSHTLPLGLQAIFGSEGRQYNLVLAGSVLAAIPRVIVSCSCASSS